ncbi:MAG: hypothetical protein V3S98_01405 [Dehalococcoidia bacterium]
MRNRAITKMSVALVAVLVLLMGNAAAVLGAPPSQEDRQPRGLFGEVVRIDGDTIIVQTASGDEVTVVTGPDTEFRAPNSGVGGDASPQVGRRVAVVLAPSEDGLVARSVMVLSGPDRDQGRRQGQGNPIVHASGVVIEIDDGALALITDNGELRLEFGLNGVPVEVGDSVTLAGTRDEESGTLRVRSAQGLGRTIQRLRDNIEGIENEVVERDDQVNHIARLKRLAEEISQRQLKLLESVEARVPEQAAKAVERALRNIQESTRAIERAIERSVELRGKQDREAKRLEHPSVRALPNGVKPSLADVAEALGITQDELLAILRAGRSLAQAADERGLDVDGLRERIVNIIRARLQRLAESGQLDAAAVDLILADIRANIGQLIERIFSDDRVRIDLPFSLEDLAALIGMEPSQFFALLREGLTPAEIAEQAGISRETLEERLHELARQRVDALVESGALTAEDGEKFIARLIENIGKLLDRAREEDKDERRERPDVDLNLSLDRELIARLLGLSVEELVAMLREGMTIQEIMERQGVSAQDIIEGLLAPVRERITNAVEQGNLDRQRAAAILAKAREQIIQMLRSFGSNRGSGENRATDQRTAKPNQGSNPLYAGVPLSANDVASALGVSPSELQKWLGSDSGIRGLLEERGIEASTLVDKLLRVVEERFTRPDNASDVAREKIISVLAETKRRLLNDLGAERSVRTADVRGGANRSGSRVLSALPFDLRRIAEAMGVETDRLEALMAEGLTVAQIADRAGVNLGRIVSSLTAASERQARVAIERGEVSEDEVRRKLEEGRRSMERALEGFKLGNNDRQRLSDSERQPDRLLNDEERRKRDAQLRTRQRERREVEARERDGSDLLRERLDAARDRFRTQRRSDGREPNGDRTRSITPDTRTRNGPTPTPESDRDRLTDSAQTDGTTSDETRTDETRTDGTTSDATR